MTVVMVPQQFVIGNHYASMMMMFVTIIEDNEPRQCNVWMHEKACRFMERKLLDSYSI